MSTGTISQISPKVLDQLSEGPRACIERLLQHDSERPDLLGQPSSGLAAVLIILYERSGQLRVLLTTRSKALRTHAGQTALPGGKVDKTDRDLVETAYREAHEEVGLPLNSPDIHTICLLEPFLSLHKLLVTPVVALLTRPALLDDLKGAAEEVACIFTHPLRALLDANLARSEALVPLSSEDWPYDVELHSTTDAEINFLANTKYRMHRFRSSASPIKGLTADILIKAAEIAFGESTIYERYAPGQVHGFAAISRLLKDLAEQSSTENTC